MRKLISSLIATLLFVGTVAAQPSYIANYYQILLPPPGFDYIGAQSNWAPFSIGSTGNAFESLEVPDWLQPSCTPTHVSHNQIQSFHVTRKQKIKSLEAVVEAYYDAFSNPAYKFRVNIWDDYSQIALSPRIGNFLSEEFTGVSFGDTINNWGYSNGSNHNWKVGWNITDRVLLKGKTYYFSVQLVTVDYTSPGDIYIAESMNVCAASPSYIAGDHAGNCLPTFFYPNVMGLSSCTHTTLAYKANASYCPMRGTC